MAFEEVTIGDCHLINADCRTVLPTLGKFDLLLTDPPYGIGHKHSGLAKGKWTRANSQPIFMDDADFDPRPFLVAPAIMFGGDHFAPFLPMGGVFHVWDKECGRTNRYDSFSDAEIFWTSFPGKRRVIRYMWKGLQVEEPSIDQERFHPTQKPVAVMRQLVDICPAAKTVLDPFMGSGTTGVACAQSGRSFTGIERERKYFDIACERISRAYAQGKLFSDAPATKPEQADILEAA